MADTTGLAAASLTFSVLSFVMLVITLIVFLFPDFRNTFNSVSSGSGSAATGFLWNVKMVVSLLGAFSPDITLLSGFISDIVNGKFRYSVTSLIGIISVIVNWGIWRFSRIVGLIKYDPASPSATPSAAAATPSASATPSAAAATATPAASRKARIGVGVGAPSVMSGLTDALNAVPDGSASERGGRPVGDKPSDNTRLLKLGGGADGEYGGTIDVKTGGAFEIPQEIASRFNPCAIRGLGMFDTGNSAMGMSALSAVWIVYFLDMLAGQKRTGAEIGGYVGFSGVVLGMNLYAYKTFQCYGDGWLKAAIVPGLVGLVCGGIGYGVLSSSFPAYLPLDAQSINSPSAPSQPSCAPPNDKDQFVCDAYKNGKRVTTSVVS